MIRSDYEEMVDQNTFNGAGVFARVEAQTGGDMKLAWRAANDASLRSEKKARDNYGKRVEY